MEALFKPPLIAVLAMVLAALVLTACAAIPSKVEIGAALSSPKVDQAAIGVEVVVATLANSFSAVVSDPKADVDRVKLARQVDQVGEVLARARRAVDSRRGGVSALVSEAFGLVSDAVPAGASMSARFAISTAFTGLQFYAATLDTQALPAEPSPALAQARERTDDALDALRAKLPPPGS